MLMMWRCTRLWKPFENVIPFNIVKDNFRVSRFSKLIWGNFPINGKTSFQKTNVNYNPGCAFIPEGLMFCLQSFLVKFQNKIKKPTVSVCINPRKSQRLVFDLNVFILVQVNPVLRRCLTVVCSVVCHVLLLFKMFYLTWIYILWSRKDAPYFNNFVLWNFAVWHASKLHF